VDPVVQSVAPQAAIPAPLTSFEGLNNQEMQYLSIAVYPPYCIAAIMMRVSPKMLLPAEISCMPGVFRPRP
jgi:hypothetical protein